MTSRTREDSGNCSPGPTRAAARLLVLPLAASLLLGGCRGGGTSSPAARRLAVASEGAAGEDSSGSRPAPSEEPKAREPQTRPTAEAGQAQTAPAASGAGGKTALSTQRMAARLREIAENADPGIDLTAGVERRVAHYRALMEAEAEPRKRAELSARLALALLRGGETTRGLVQLTQTLTWFKTETGVYPRQLLEMLATGHLRRGEQENCIAQHGPDSCIFPIRGSGVHRNRRGSEEAVKLLTALARQFPDDVSYRWLLNLAHQTLGQGAEAIPEELRLPADLMASEHELRPFPNVASRLGLDLRGLAGSVVMEDMDGDGDLDLVVSDWGALAQLRYFRNEGDGRFTERTHEAGLTGLVGGLNLLHADHDNDGDVDLLVLRGAWFGRHGRQPNSLIENLGDGTFRDVTVEAGLVGEFPTQAAAWADYDGDGWLDLFIGNESDPSQGVKHPCELYRNNGDGTFTDVAAAVGVAHVGFVKGVAFGDYDNDGDPDLYLSCLKEKNVLFRNDGPSENGWSFTDVAARAGVEEPLPSFPTWFWDHDNDGWLDLFVAPFPGFKGDHLGGIVASYLGRETDLAEARLYRNRGDGTFEDVTERAGLNVPMLAMGANFGDFDNDGFEDLHVGTGEPSLRCLVPNRAYRNDGQGRFQNVTTAGRFGHLQKGHGIAFGDLDRDGDQDIYAVMGGAYEGDVAYNALFLNPGHGHHWITLRLVGEQAPRCGIGARIQVDLETAEGTRTLHRLVSTGGSFGSNSLQQEIGLGAHAGPVRITVRWPGAQEPQVFEQVPADGIYRLRQGRPQPEVIAQVPIPL